MGKVRKRWHRNPGYGHTGDEISEHRRKKYTGLQRGMKLKPPVWSHRGWDFKKQEKKIRWVSTGHLLVEELFLSFVCRVTQQIRNLSLTGIEHATEHCHRFRSKAKYLLFFNFNKFHNQKITPCNRTTLSSGPERAPDSAWCGYFASCVLKLICAHGCYCRPQLQNCFSISRFYPWPHPSFSERRWNNLSITYGPSPAPNILAPLYTTVV
jgi:hypothetical protein